MVYTLWCAALKIPLDFLFYITFPSYFNIKDMVPTLSPDICIRLVYERINEGFISLPHYQKKSFNIFFSSSVPISLFFRLVLFYDFYKFSFNFGRGISFKHKKNSNIRHHPLTRHTGHPPIFSFMHRKTTVHFVLLHCKYGDL